MPKVKSKQKGVAGVIQALPKHEPLWTGPNGAGPNGGVTFSLLCRFLTCRERFRLYAIEGLRPPDQFDAKLEFGSMWHICEEALARDIDYREPLLAYGRELCRRYPTQQEQCDHWYRMVKAAFPIYASYWSQSSEQVSCTSLLREHCFDVPYSLPSGRKVRLRGKWDGVDLVKEE